VVFNATLTWANPALVTLERQMETPLFGDDPVEMGVNDANRDAVLQRLRDDTTRAVYPQRFAAADARATQSAKHETRAGLQGDQRRVAISIGIGIGVAAMAVKMSDSATTGIQIEMHGSISTTRCIRISIAICLCRCLCFSLCRCNCRCLCIGH
jgi:hypothetical protein